MWVMSKTNKNLIILKKQICDCMKASLNGILRG